MISSIEDFFSIWPYPELVPFIAIIFAIIVLLLARIARCSVFTTFASAGFFIVLLWVITLNLGALDSQGQLGISFTGLVRIALITLLPVLLIILLMVYAKNADDNRKNDAALLLLIKFFGRNGYAFEHELDDVFCGHSMFVAANLWPLGL